MIMRSSSINTPLSSSTGGKAGGRTLPNSNKPPIPPKPILHSRHRPLTDQKQELVNIPNDRRVTTNYFPVPRYSTYPTAVLIKDENIPYVGNNDFDAKHALETLTPLSSVSCKEEKYNGSLSNLPQMSLQGVLPPLTKAEITPKYTLTQVNPQIYELKSNTRSGGRTLSASAKNALLMEKIGGTVVNYHDGSKEILPRANSNPETSSSLSVTVNRSCIISVNNFNNSFNNNNYTSNEVDTRNIRSNQRRSLNLDNPKPSVCSEVIINSVPIATSVALTKKNYRQDNVDASHCNDVCSACNFYRTECRCEQQESRESLSVYIVNKRKSTEDPLQGTEIFLNGGFNHEDNTTLKNKSPTLREDRVPARVDEIDSSYTHRPRLSNASPNLTLSQSAPCSPATKPLLQKSEAIDMEDYDYYKRLSRGISRATDNVNIVSRARSEIAQGIWEALESGNNTNNTPFFVETPVFTFTLPDLSVYSDEFRSFLEKDLIEMSTLVSLEAAGRLNWWAIIGASQRLWPLATTGDGNCLLHAASLGMWGFHDRLLTLRKALHEFLTRSKFSRPLWRRWRWQLAMQNKETGLVLSQDEWEVEWESVLRLASSAPRGCSLPLENTTNSAPNLSQTASSLSQGKLNSEFSGPVYESLEEIHVLALAHVLRRPIIVVADTTLKDMNGDPLAPIPFGGIYLPLECPPRECQRSPLLLTYDAAHFSALVIMESSEKEDSSKPPLSAVIPVSDCFHELLPIQFLVDPGEDFVWGRDELDEHVIQKLTITSHDKKGLLNEYLDLVQVPIPSTYLEASAPSGGQEEPSHDPSDPLLDIDKKSSESSFDSDDGPPFSDGGGTLSSKAKGPKQLQTVVRSFGSIGRSMSKRIKKNLNTLSKFSRSGSFRRKNHLLTKGEFACPKGGKGVRVGTQQSFILGARIHTDKRHAYQQEMIENYLANARERFMRDVASQRGGSNKQSRDVTSVSSVSSSESCLKQSDNKGMQCINPGCNLYGTAQTSYMCSSCFNRQKEQEEREYQRQSSGETKPIETQGETRVDDVLTPSPPAVRGDGLQYGAGKSKFYAALDETSVKSATLIPVTHSMSGQKDKTLFLSNSTFYNDTSVAATIPSYNLNRDLNRDLKKGKPGISKPSSETSISSRSSSSLSDPLQVNRFSQDHNSFTSSAKDTLAPICIDDVRMQLNKAGCGPQKASARPSKETSPATHTPTTVDSNYTVSKPCLTKGCDFYGSAATDYFCSKCHLSKKKSSSGIERHAVDQVKYVQI